MTDYKPSVQSRIKVALLGMALCCLPFWKGGCHAALMAYLVLWALEGNWNSKIEGFRHDAFTKMVVIFSLIILAGLLYTEDWASEKFPLTKKAFLILLPFAIVTSRDQLSKQDIRSMLAAFTIVCGTLIVIASFWSASNYLKFLDGDVNALSPTFSGEQLKHGAEFWTFVTYINFAKTVRLHPTYFSLYLATSVLFLLNELSEKAWTVLKISIVIIFCSAIVLLSSRIVMIATALLLLLRVIYSMQQSPRVALTIAMLLLCSIAMAAFNPVSRYRGWDEIKSTPLAIVPNKLYTNSTEIRASLWYLGWEAFQSTNPIIGTGTGDVSKQMKLQRDNLNITNVLDNYDPHNQYLHTMIAHGIVGVACLVSILAIATIRGVRDRNFLLIGFIVLISIVSITESMLEVQKGIVLFAILLPLLMQMKGAQVKQAF